jgi:hypothetical protein
VQKCPGLRLVVSFADPEQGHVGGIYQGGGWIYTGRSQSADEYIVNGKRIHGRSLRALRASDRRAPHAKNAEEWARLVLDPNTKKISGSSKHRYLMPLDEGMRRRVSQIAKPYPKKRAGSIVDDAPVVQTGEGGSVPTPALPRAAAAGE